VSYELELRPEVKDDFKQLDKVIATRVLKKLQWLSEQGEQVEHQSLAANLAGFYKLRIGDYRVIYKLESNEGEPESEGQSEKDELQLENKVVAKSKLGTKVVVYFIGHRRDIYKKLE
jgi:mRNA interferase RelE/StbE